VREGDVVGDRFEIERRVAAGGMGAVYRARDRVSGAPIALKIMLDSDEVGVERFMRESGMLAGLSHASLVSYVAHGQAPIPWLAMEWLEGEDLAARLSRGAIALDEAIAMATRIADALSLLHQRGFVHRDIKPSNIFLVGKDPARAKLLDLGVARSLGGEMALTKSGFAIGTPYYMAPEQARATPDVDARADVFALGCVLFECLSGHPPFRGHAVVEVLAKILLDRPPRLTTGSPLDSLVERMLEKDRERRPPNGGEVAEELMTLARATTPVASRSPGIAFGEQRVMTVILTGRADPLAATVHPGGDPLAAMRSAAAQVSARVEPLANGSVLIVLSDPAVALDQSRSAAMLALEIRRTSPGLALSIATGRAELTGGAPIGEAVSRAARALDHAREGRIRVDSVAAALLGARFELGHDDAGDYLERERGDRLVARHLLGKPTAFVGREREIGVLEGLFRECIDEPRACVALVSGPAGAGKSRLRDELIARLGSIELFFGIAEVARAGTSFGLLSNAIRRSAHIDDASSLDAQQALLRARVSRSLSGDALERVLPFVGEIAAIHFDDGGSQALQAARRDPLLMGDAVRSAFEEWMRAECARGPMAIVLDDVHWGDAPSMRLVDHALRLLGDRQLFVVSFARPEVYEVFPALFRERDVQEIRLSAIGKRACERLARDALQDTSDETIAWIVDRAHGNAFFLEELIRAAAQGAVDVPETVLGVVQARLDALGPTAKRVLRAGSVFGETFWSSGVSALLSESTNKNLFAELVAAEVIERQSRPRFAGDAFAFRHALLRDAAYAMLTDRDRTTAHQLAAEWLEAQGGNNALELAEHYRKADDRPRAARFFADAAEQAIEGNDLEGAALRALRGIECGAEGELLGRFCLVQTIAAMWRGAHADALRLSQQAASLLPEGSAQWFRAMAESMSAAGRTGNRDALGDGARKLLAVEPREDTRDEHVIALARSLIPTGNASLPETDAVLDRAIAIAGDDSLLGPMARAQLLEARGLRRLMASDFTGLPILEEAVRAYDTAGAVRDRCLTGGSLAWARYRAGFNEDALAAADDALRLAIAHSLDQARWWATFVRGCALARLSRTVEAMATLRECLVAYRAQGNRRHEGWAGYALSEVLLAIGRLDEAEHVVRDAVPLLEPTPIFSVGALATHARVLIALGRYDDARSVLARAFRVFEVATHLAHEEPRLRLAEAELARSEGDDARVIAVARAASGELTRHMARFDDSVRSRYLAIPEHALLMGMAALDAER
jgi:eukaryotic-like serine/threonine-protein kinase